MNMNISNKEEKIVIAQIYLVHLLSRVDGIFTSEPSIKKFAKRIYQSRYKSVIPENRYLCYHQRRKYFYLFISIQS